MFQKQDGRVVKQFDLKGCNRVNQVFLWLWREIFLILLATGSRHSIGKLTSMLEDVENRISWQALIHVLNGGTKGVSSIAFEKVVELTLEYRPL